MASHFRSSALISTLVRLMMWAFLGVVVALAIAWLQLTMYRAPSSLNSANQPTTGTTSSEPVTTQPAALQAAIQWNQTWVMSAAVAKDWVGQPGVVLLDARGLSRRILTHIKGAMPVHWRSFSRTEAPYQGKLLDYRRPEQQQQLEQTLGNLGISDSTVVLVYGEPTSGWGEEGRIVWMLKTLGHEKTAWIDGGIQALIDQGLKTSVLPNSATPASGHFHVRAQSIWTIRHEELKRQLDEPDFKLIDTREEREYEGATPYGEQRGGHIPGAIHIYFKQLLADDGRLKRPEEIQQLLSYYEIRPQSEVAAYCTGGIRSAWFISVLNNLGYSAKNYPGSAWEWAALPEDAYPLERK